MLLISSQDARKKASIFLFFLLSIILFSTEALSIPVHEFPYIQNFEQNNYQDTLRLYTDNPSDTKGCVHEWVSNGGWRGSGAAKFYPPTEGQSYCGFNHFSDFNNGSGTEQLNVRFLIKHGSEYYQRPKENKLVIFNRNGVRQRPMIGENWYEDGQWNSIYRSYAPCDNTTCRYDSGESWPEGNDRFTIGPKPDHRSEEWVSVELEANVRTGIIRLYIDTEDGELSGLYRELPFQESPLGTPLFHFIDMIGGFFNFGSPANPDNYQIFDELVISDQHIGPPEGFAGGVSSTENSYVILNPGMVSGGVISLADNNVITAGNRTLNLDLYERGSFWSSAGPVLTQGMVVTGTGPFEIGSGIAATDIPAHASMAGTQFIIPHTRYGHHYYMVSPDGDTTAQINVGGDQYQVSLPQGNVVEFDAGETNRISSVITSERPILVSHRGDPSNASWYADANIVPPAAVELWGFRSSSAVIAAAEDNTHVTMYTSDGRRGSSTLQAGQMSYVTVGDPSGQGEGSAVHLVADKPIGAVQIADGDGADQTAFFPTPLLNRRFGLPRDAQYIAVACPERNTSITLYNGNNPPETRVCRARRHFPGKVYFGSPINGAHISFGSYLESNKPIHVIYEQSNSNDEHNMIGTSE